MNTAAFVAAETPRNGLAGLKHWRHDVLAGLVVSLVSVPFSLGIAIASGAPPICGLISAIVAGIVLPFLGGSYVTISGPAAGLAPALLAAMLILGRGDKAIGYPLLLVAIGLTGVVQLALARFRMAKFSAMFPSSVVEGMLAAIGLLILAKELPLLVGHSFVSHDFWGILAEAPSQLANMEPKVFLLGMACLVLIFVLASVKARWIKVVPPQVFAAILGLILGQVMGLSTEYMIHIPDRPFEHGIVLPNFQGVMADHSIWWAIFIAVVTLTLIDGVESLATIAAIDKIDPFRRKSDPNQTLLAMGVSNVASSLVGGLTIIPGGVKSTTCIVAGGRTQWANFYNAMFLIVYIVIGRQVINMMPLSALGAIIIYSGYKLCAPKVWKHIATIGGEQLFVFSVTVLTTLTTDLLWGIAGGMIAKLALEAWITARAEHGAGNEPLVGKLTRYVTQTFELFRNPVVQTVSSSEGYHLYFARPLVCFNSLHLSRALAQIPSSVSAVYFHVTDLVTLIDHTTTTTLFEFVEDFKRSGRGVAHILGLERLHQQSNVTTSMRTGPRVLAQERAEAYRTMAGFSLSSDSAAPENLVRELDLISLRGSTSDSSGHPLSAFLIETGRRISGNAAGALRILQIDPQTIDPASSDLELNWMSLSTLEREPFESANTLDFLGLTKRDQSPNVGEFESEYEIPLM